MNDDKEIKRRAVADEPARYMYRVKKFLFWIISICAGNALLQYITPQ